jgi:UDP-N-acetylglucosamine 2-epimerase
MREVTERPEAMNAGVARIVGTDRNKIVANSTELLTGNLRATMSRPGSPYGDGKAGERIAEIVVQKLTGKPRTVPDWNP